jgi:hypothetical protein
LVNPTFATFTVFADAKITSVGSFCKNSTVPVGIVNDKVDAAPTAVEILTVAAAPEPLYSLTQVASLILDAVPAVVGIAISVVIIFVLCIGIIKTLLVIYKILNYLLISSQSIEAKIWSSLVAAVARSVSSKGVEVKLFLSN